MKIRDRIKKLVRVPASELIPNPKNWRTHPEEQQNALRGVLAEVGIADALIARETEDGLQLIDGHLRADVDPSVEWPVLVLDVTEEEADKILATHDPLTMMAEVDNTMLSKLLDDVEMESADVQKMLDELPTPAAVEIEIVEDEVPETPAEPITQPGDLWLLGDHRLLCGDSTNPDYVARLMDGKKSQCVFTDPPYNVASGSKNFAANVSKSMGDLAKAEWDKNYDFATTAMQLENVMDTDCVVYVCTSHWLAPSIWEWMRTWATLTMYCVWCKPNPMPSLSMRHWTWGTELITYGSRGKHTANFPKGNHALNWWNIAKQKDTVHPTEKPVAVPARGIGFSSQPGDIVVDLFLGSGTTLIACEQLDRTCYGMEISPAYCDVIVKRWEKLTGEKAKRPKRAD